jgi:hypothetical protein
VGRNMLIGAAAALVVVLALAYKAGLIEVEIEHRLTVERTNPDSRG